MFADIHLYMGVAVAGLVSFLSPCVLPLVPPYLGYLSGSTIDHLSRDDGPAFDVWSRVVLSSILFVLGFTTVFVGLGASASLAGKVLLSYRSELGLVAGIIIIIFGLHFLGILQIPFLNFEKRYHYRTAGASYLGAYLIGLSFAFGWTPCIGPVLASVLALAANEATLISGILLLFTYSLGLGIPFILASIAIKPFLSLMLKFRARMRQIEQAMGVLLVITGFLFLTGSINWLGQWMLQTLPILSQLEEKFTPKSLTDQIMKKSLE